MNYQMPPYYFAYIKVLNDWHGLNLNLLQPYVSPISPSWRAQGQNAGSAAYLYKALVKLLKISVP